MKLTASLIILSINSFACFSQTVDTVWWEDRSKHIVIKEQNKVWIHLKKGRKLKNVKINAINMTNGRIEYLSGGVFHDQLISEVKKITPGNDYGEVIYFKNDSLPVVKEEFNPHSITITGFFVSHEIKNNTDIYYAGYTPQNENTADTLFYSDGKMLLIKVKEISDFMLIYKRLDLPDGPLYRMDIADAEVRSFNNIYSIDFQKNNLTK